MAAILVTAVAIFVGFALAVWDYALALLKAFIIFSGLQTETGSRAIGKGWEKDGRGKYFNDASRDGIRLCGQPV